jgi:predicted LPLAT superfamily acyltransferase
MSGPVLAPAHVPAKGAEWLSRKERGGVVAIRLTVFLVTVFGRTLTRLVARLVALYYVLTSPSARAGLRAFYLRLEGRAPSFGRLYRHFLRFVFSTLDAFFLASGKTRGFEVTRNGHQHLEALRVAKKGAILLGAHVGSFYAMRIQGHEEGLRLFALMHTKNARMLNDALEKLDPEGAARVVRSWRSSAIASRPGRPRTGSCGCRSSVPRRPFPPGRSCSRRR